MRWSLNFDEFFWGWAATATRHFPSHFTRSSYYTQTSFARLDLISLFLSDFFPPFFLFIFFISSSPPPPAIAFHVVLDSSRVSSTEYYLCVFCARLCSLVVVWWFGSESSKWNGKHVWNMRHGMDRLHRFTSHHLHIHMRWNIFRSCMLNMKISPSKRRSRRWWGKRKLGDTERFEQGLVVACNLREEKVCFPTLTMFDLPSSSSTRVWRELQIWNFCSDKACVWERYVRCWTSNGVELKDFSLDMLDSTRKFDVAYLRVTNVWCKDSRESI